VAHRRVLNFHAGRERFETVNVFTEALNKRYGTATSLDDYERKAQAQAYDNERSCLKPMAEQIRIHRRDSVDAQQCLAFADLAPLRLLSRARRRLFSAPRRRWSRARAVQLRRQLRWRS